MKHTYIIGISNVFNSLCIHIVGDADRFTIREDVVIV